jgi:hypothetical protein
MSDSMPLENRWFHEKDERERQALRQKIEGRAAAEANRRKIAENIGSDDTAVIARIEALGLDGEVGKVLHLLPLVGVAWADDTISVSERRAIMNAVAAHGVADSDPGAIFIASLLETRPSETLRSEVLSILKDILAAKGMSATSMIEACQKVAEASGGLLGFGNKVDDAERTAILELIEQLGPAIDDRAKSEFG